VYFLSRHVCFVCILKCGYASVSLTPVEVIIDYILMKTIIQRCARNVLKTKNNVMASSTAKLSSILPDSVKKGFTDVSQEFVQFLFYYEYFVLLT
jgi:hypothetical protein